MRLVGFVPMALFGVLLFGCAGHAGAPANAPTTGTAEASATASDTRTSESVSQGYVTVGAAKSGVNAASPTRCTSARVQFTEARVGTVIDSSGNAWQVPAAIHEGDTGVDLYNDCTGSGANRAYATQLKTVVVEPDGVEITAFVHADNYFELYVNGVFVCRDPIAFTPFNSTACRFRAKYPMTYALRGVDWEEHLGVGLEYDRMNVGDAGIVARFSDGTVTDASWKAEVFYLAPLDNPGCVKIPQSGARDSASCPIKPSCVTNNPLSRCEALHFREPENWANSDFDDAAWPAATVYTRQQFGPKEAYTTIESLFGSGKFIWSRNLNIDNLVLLRKTVPAPAR